VVIKGLANSKTFQRFALKTHTHIEQAKKASTETFEQQLEDLASKATGTEGVGGATSSMRKQGPPRKPAVGFTGFRQAFGKEVRRDLGL
jgi:hypothetical protein